MPELMKKIGNEWSNMDGMDKAKYEELSKIDRERYQEELHNMPENVVIKHGRRRRRCKQKNVPKKVMSPYICFVKEVIHSQ